MFGVQYCTISYYYNSDRFHDRFWSIKAMMLVYNVRWYWINTFAKSLSKFSAIFAAVFNSFNPEVQSLICNGQAHQPIKTHSHLEKIHHNLIHPKITSFKITGCIALEIHNYGVVNSLKFDAIHNFCPKLAAISNWLIFRVKPSQQLELRHVLEKHENAIFVKKKVTTAKLVLFTFLKHFKSKTNDARFFSVT